MSEVHEDLCRAIMWDEERGGGRGEVQQMDKASSLSDGFYPVSNVLN